MDTAGQYFYPFEMEFCLSALALLLSMTKPTAKKKTESTYIYIEFKCSMMNFVPTKIPNISTCLTEKIPGITAINFLLEF